MVKLPLPPGDLAESVGIRDDEMRRIDVDALLWRVHRVRGESLTPWNRLRHYGSVDARFEPHPPPQREHPGRAVWYAAATPRTAIAEVFQRTRTVPMTDTFHLTAARLTRPVQLLDVTGEPDHGAWATRAGASMALSTGRHDYSCAWAREICNEFPDLDGLAHRAAMEGGLAVALFLPAADAMPRDAVTSRALSDPALASRIAGICRTIGYQIVGHYRP
jgi:hypothetical protein